MKELNERQKAEHASRMFNRLKSSLDDLQNRNSELENKFSQLTKLNLEAQRTERDLRDELAEVVPRSVSDADRKKIAGLEEDLIKTKTKMSQLQDISDISHNQLRSVQSQQQARDREMKSLRQQLKEFQFQTDQNALIGKLHHQILNLQASEMDSERTIEKAKKNVTKLQAHVVKLEKKIDEKEDSVYLTRTESSNKNRQLKKTIQSLRQQFSGALPLAQQEKFARSMARLHEDKLMIQEELRRTRKEREKIEDKLVEAEVQKQGLDELRKAIEDERGADKLTEWCHRMDNLRLQDMKLQRQVVRQNEQIKHVETLNGQYEKTISSLEEDIVQILKVQEEHQVEWELREMELEKLLDTFQSKQREVTKRAKRLEDITQTLPDPSLPLDQQLTSALKTNKDHMQTNRDLQGQIKALELENDRLKDVRHTLESNVTSRDRIINELRLNMPITSTRTVKSEVAIESKQQLRVAMDTIETLKKRLSAKEESIDRYKQLLEEARKENEQASHSHEKELMSMQQRIHGKTDDAFNRFKKAARGVTSPRSSAPSASDLRNISELEEMVREQDVAMSALMDRVRAANVDVAKQKKNIAELRRRHEAEKHKIQEEHEQLVAAIKNKLMKKHRRIDDLEKELSYIQSELEKQKDANSRAPATTIKNLVARLKTQLSEKEKQQQQLSHALAELRSDLVLQAQENVRAAHAEENDAVSVKGLVGKRTAQYKLQIEELKDSLAEQQRGLKQAKRTEETLKGELKKILEETEKKEQIIQKHKLEKRSQDNEIMQLKDKIKRLCRSRGPDSGLKFAEETPVKLVAEPVVKPVKKQPVEGAVMNIDRDLDEGTSSSSLHSAASRLPRTSRPSTVADEERMSRLKADLSRLRGENDNLKEKLKKKIEVPTKSTIEVAKWDVKKQWQSKVENLKQKVQDKDKLIQTFEKQIDTLKDQISRLEREKLRRTAAPIGPPIHANPTLEDAVVPSDQIVRKHLHTIEELSSQLHELGEENNRLRKLTELPRDKIAAEMDAKNANLNQKLETLQKEILTAGLRQERDESIAEQYRQSENQMQGRMLKLASDATELQFNYDQVKRDVPRLKERIEHQQQYINLLKSEKREAEQRAERSKKQTSQKTSVGQSGKTIPELEKTIILMKKVVERVQRENDQLKKAPGVVTNQALDELKSENQILKNQINDMTQQIGGQLSMRYESKTQSVDRLMKENEKLRRELDKRGSSRDKMRDSRAFVQVERDQLFKELEETKKKLIVAQSKAPKLAGAGSRGYNSAVTSKMLESRLKKSEETVEKQSSEMRALKSFLGEKEETENDLQQEVERLKEQNEILERFPPGAGSSDPNTIRELQIIRLTVARLEHEKKELEHSILKLEKQNVNQPSTSTNVPDNLSTKANHLKLATENHVTNQENERLKTELEHAKKELSHFDDTFFDEIEDLKYNYAEAVKKNVLYEGQLHHYSNLFGFEIDIPANDE